MYTLNLATSTVTRDSDGAVAEPYQDVNNPVTQGYYDWLAQGNSPTVVNVPPPVPDKPRIKVGAFRERLGEAAKVKIELASVDDPDAPLNQRMLSAKLRVFKDDLETYTHVDLNRPDVLAGLQQLLAVGLVAQADIDRIYAKPFRDEELWHG